MARAGRRCSPLTAALLLAIEGCLSGTGAPPPSSDGVAKVEPDAQAPPPAATPTEARPADPEQAPVPEPEPEPQPEPVSAEEAAELLAGAQAGMKELGTSRSPRTTDRGRDPTGGHISRAYAEGRALGYAGRIEQVRLWMARAKFGQEAPTDPTRHGPLARYDLLVTTPETNRTDRAWLHVIVPEYGLAADLGEHAQLDAKGRWLNLHDRAEAGVDFVPFKRNGHLDLNKQWGREEVIDDLVVILRGYRKRAGVPAGVGDISEVTGGKIKDHWTHRVGMDADVYVLDFPEVATGDLGAPQVVWHYRRRGKVYWSTEAEGKGKRYDTDDQGENAITQRLRHLAEEVLEHDDVHIFIHDASSVLAPFDDQARERREGRRFLHLDNHGYWPRHPDHVHLRWTDEDGPLPYEAAPRP